MKKWIPGSIFRPLILSLLIGAFLVPFQNCGRVNFGKVKDSLSLSSKSPGDLKALSASLTTITLTWRDDTVGETGFEIERSQNPEGPFTLVISVPSNTTTYQDTSLDPDTNFYYRVRAILGDRKSDFSTLLKAATLPIRFTTIAANAEGFTELAGRDIRCITFDSGKMYVGTSTGMSISTDGGVHFANVTTKQGLGDNLVYDIKAVGNKIFVATQAGISISSDSGLKFENKTKLDGLVSDQVISVAIDSTGNTVYAATTGGLSVSTDGGKTFTNNLLIGKILTSVVLQGSELYVSSRSGLYYSTDGGANFLQRTTALNGLISDSVNKISLDSANPGTGRIYVSTYSGYAYSTDKGVSWTSVTSSTTNLPSNLIFDVYASGSLVLVGTSLGLAISTDNGASFILKDGPSGLGGVGTSRSVVNIQRVGNIIYAATHDGFSTSDGTLNYSTMRFQNFTALHGIIGPRVTDVLVDESTIMAASSMGISISQDGGRSFDTSFSTGFAVQGINHLARRGTSVLAGSDIGVGVSRNNGLSYTIFNQATGGIGDNFVQGVHFLGDTVVVGTTSGVGFLAPGATIFTTKNVASGIGLPSDIINSVGSIGTTLLLGTNGGLAISTDGGVSFQKRVVADNIGLKSNVIKAITTTATKIYLATTNGLSISDNGGSSFVTRTTLEGLPSNSIRDVEVSGNLIVVATDQGISYSVNGGAKFFNSSTLDGLPSNNVTKVFIFGDTIYAATYAGLGKSY